MDKKFELRVFELENFNISENHFDQIYDILDSAKKELELKKQEYIETLKDIGDLCIEVVEPMFFVEEDGKYYLKETVRYKWEQKQ